jgi:hypothetical protein
VTSTYFNKEPSMPKLKTYVTSIVSPSLWESTPRDATAKAGILCIVAAAMLVLGCAITQLQTATTNVPDDAWRYPWSSTGFIITTLLWATLQSAVIPAALAFHRSGVAGPGGSARWGGRLVVTGIVIGVIAHLSSLPFVDQTFDDPVVVVIAAMFGVGALLSTVGFILAGIGTLHAGRWSGWARWVPLGIGLFGVALLFLQFTPLLPAAVGLYYAGFIALGLALARQR